MLALIFPTTDHLAAKNTLLSIRTAAPHWKTMVLDKDFARTINRQLLSYKEPFFATFYAGDILYPSFEREMKTWLHNMPQDSGGIFLEQTGGRRNHPVIWRTTAILGSLHSGLPDTAELPFEDYLLADMFHRLDASWNWIQVSDPPWKPATAFAPRWAKAEEEWALIQPILAAEHDPGLSSGNPKISVAICTYNDFPYLPWAIRSVIAQTFRGWELIILDDGSTDEMSTKIIDSTKMSPIRVVTNKINQGKAKCLNQALGLAKGEWLLELDADDWLAPEALETLWDAAVNLPESTALLYADHYEWYERKRKKLIFQGIRHAPASFDYNQVLSAGYPLAPRMYRISSLRELGGWLTADPFQGRLYEDFQILARLSLHREIHHIPRPLYHRRIRSGSITHSHMGKYEIWKKWIYQQLEKDSRRLS